MSRHKRRIAASERRRQKREERRLAPRQPQTDMQSELMAYRDALIAYWERVDPTGEIRHKQWKQFLSRCNDNQTKKEEVYKDPCQEGHL
jgi:hypothetical protein